ncbi:tRNA (adenosine(37)-N6)-threonylcarbamoyltransferase complex ATPase subunit type 1 TsaE [bacterium]|nr:tRNA (adenosine(37)-N6)-threonylcarbamoyltransferase complex ATPase subunit type 1 TsaE [bacterium]
MLEKITKTELETINIAKEFVNNIETNVLAMEGDLGAGKTTFAKGLAQGLKIKKEITSPTFTIIKLYKTKNKKYKQLCHIDTYRLNSEEELLSLGFDEYIKNEKTLTLIEWSEKIKNLLPEKYYKISIEHINETTRKIKISLIKK